MNKLYLIIPSNLNEPSNFLRLAKSIDISENIFVYFINQSEQTMMEDVYSFSLSKVQEIRTGKIVPLSVARNIALRKIYKERQVIYKESLIMFVDDDAWFPVETINSLLTCEIKAFSLKTIDPELNRSFSLSNQMTGEIKGWHLIHDIVSISLVLPLEELDRDKSLFNENLGLGNKISQGEESLFVYNLYKNGTRFYYDEHFIYHPYKKNFNMKNFYSMSYFWTWGLKYISIIFLFPCIKYLLKYTIALGLIFKDKRYLSVFANVWRGAFDGLKNKYSITN